MKIRATIARPGVDAHGERYDADALRRMAATAPGHPVLIEFDARRPLGTIESAQLRDDGAVDIVCNLDIDERTFAGAIRGSYLAPELLCQKWTELDDGVRRIDRAELLSVGVVQRHADPTIQPAERLGWIARARLALARLWRRLTGWAAAFPR